MRDDVQPWVQLATRISKTLHRDMKLLCVRTETSVMAFVVGAIQDKLARETAASGKARRATSRATARRR